MGMVKVSIYFSILSLVGSSVGHLSIAVILSELEATQLATYQNEQALCLLGGLSPGAQHGQHQEHVSPASMAY